MFNKLLPYHTNRRLFAVTLAKGLRGRAAIRERFVAENWKIFKKFSHQRFVCNVCGQATLPFFDFPNLRIRREHRIGVLRETMQCRQCGGTMRHRSLAWALLKTVASPGLPAAPSIRAIKPALLDGRQILDTDAFSPISRILRKFPGYTVSSFMPNQPFNAEIAERHLNLNLEKMGLPSESIDIVMTSDVMEHVRDIDAAHSEIARVLKPGGHYIFTVPYDENSSDHIRLVDTSGPEDVHVVEPHYHGDPLTAGILAYRIFGRQIFRDLEALGFDVKYNLVNDDKALIVGGDVFIATKKN